MQVLVADDDEASRVMLTRLVQQLGHHPLVAADGKEALEQWTRHRPALVLTDWSMPRLGGIELCTRIREAETDEYTYIVMVTGFDSKSDLVQGFDSGVDDYITKPVDPTELAVRMRSGERVLNLVNKDMVILAMAKLAETRDPETGMHLERIQGYCRILCEHLFEEHLYRNEVNRTFIENMTATSPLHDIGKVGIPDRVLLKPGPLDSEEFEIMKRHTVIGHETLRSTLEKEPRSAYLRMAADVARSHHERWDGSGYPDGLSGTDIPLSARILSLADVYDAVTSQRVYKQACSHQEAFDMLQEGRGTQFEPTLIDAFNECAEQFADIARRLREEEVAVSAVLRDRD